jgi:hypothetical protein
VADQDRPSADRLEGSMEAAAWQTSLPPVTKLVYVALSRLADQASQGLQVRHVEELRAMTGLPDEVLQHHAAVLVDGGQLELGPCAHHPTPVRPPSRTVLRLAAVDGRQLR